MNGEFIVAVHSLVFLNHKKAFISSDAIAENVCTNPARIRKIMAKLKAAKIIVTKEGAIGGYNLARSASEITLCQIAAALNTKIVAAKWHSGNPDLNCLISSGMANIMDDLCQELDTLAYQHLDKITIDSLDKKIFY